ncbi:hypothetical protein IU475_01775 [Nocardia beijingensis]|nr:hypothetical protein [Nocardia beijingensis]
MFTVPMLNPRPTAIAIHPIAVPICFERRLGNHSAIFVPSPDNRLSASRLCRAAPVPAIFDALTWPTSVTHAVQSDFLATRGDRSCPVEVCRIPAAGPHCAQR